MDKTKWNSRDYVLTLKRDFDNVCYDFFLKKDEELSENGRKVKHFILKDLEAFFNVGKY